MRLPQRLRKGHLVAGNGRDRHCLGINGDGIAHAPPGGIGDRDGRAGRAGTEGAACHRVGRRSGGAVNEKVSTILDNQSILGGGGAVGQNQCGT